MTNTTKPQGAEAGGLVCGALGADQQQLNYSTTPPTYQSTSGNSTEALGLLQNIPDYFKQFPNFVLWRHEERNGIQTKSPYSPHTGRFASINEPLSWGTFEQCLSLLPESGMDGLGFVITPSCYLTCIDVDDPYKTKPDGTPKFANPDELRNWQIEISKAFNTYQEISPSGQGLHIWLRGSVPSGRDRHSVGLYPAGRFMTMTGQVYNPAPIAEYPDLLHQLWADLGPPENKQQTEVINSDQKQTDEEILAAMLGAANGAKAKDLWDGEWERRYRSQSEADFALINIISFNTQNRAQIMRMFRKSGLGKRKKAQRDNYVSRMIDRSFDGQIPPIDLTALRANLDQKWAALVAEREKSSATGDKPTKQEDGDQPETALEKLKRGYEVKAEYVNTLGKEEFIYRNLIIKNHILVIIALSGGGKTTFLYFDVAPKLAVDGYKVWYIDADSPPSDHKKMKAIADQYGFIFMIPDVNMGKSVKSLIGDIEEIAAKGESLENNVFFFDTLKKFANLMGKESTKGFFVLMRKLTKLGATIVLPGHANKYLDPQGNLIPEGVGDVKSDADDLIFFNRDKKPDGSIDITTVVDSDKGAKVRGMFEPFSFNISKEREITFYEKPLDTIDLSNTGISKATDEEIIQIAVSYVKSRSKPVKQSQLVQYTSDKLSGKAGINKVRMVIVQRSVLKNEPLKSGTRLICTVGDKNGHYYELPENESKQTSLWGG